MERIKIQMLGGFILKTHARQADSGVSGLSLSESRHLGDKRTLDRIVLGGF